jgi:hypothetical protein
MNFLHLPGWTVTSVKESANDYRVEATCEEGVEEKTVRNLFRAFVERLDAGDGSK